MSDSSQGPIVLPVSTIQNDFQDVIRDVLDGTVPDEKFWISCYKFGEPSVHGKAIVTLDENDRNLLTFQGQDGVEMKDYGNKAFAISCAPLDIGETRMAVPTASYTTPDEVRQSKQITAFDVAPDGTQFAAGYHDGLVFIRPLSSPHALPSFTSKAHLSTVTSLRFFPSSRVILTSGADFSLSILSAELPETPTGYTTTKANPARTLRGHTRAITSTGIVARGRNILSGSKDGTVRLWDVPSSAQIRSLAAGANRFVPVLAMSTGSRWNSALTPADTAAPDADAHEVETSDKVVFCALEDGSFELFDLRTKRAEFRAPPPSSSSGVRAALQAIAYALEHNFVATGSASGLAAVYDTRSLGAGPVVSFRRNEAPVEDVAFVELSPSSFALGAASSAGGGVGLAIATEDGLPYVADVSPNGPVVRAELVGADCDAVRFVRVVGRDVWSASDDGAVRRYVS